MTDYPHFIQDRPLGRDCFDGHSQEHLAHSICNYVRMTDFKPTGKAKAGQLVRASMPRIIGLEGDWGSGKSNVVSMVGGELKGEGYYTFTYDAWGHQEDLQRRSILETLTGKLIQDEVLKGEVEIPLRNGKKNNATWNNQLSLLLSNKTTTIRKSTPKLTAAAFWGIVIVVLFAFCSLITGQLIFSSIDFKCYWWINLIPVFVAFIVATCYRIKDGNFDNIFRMVDYTANDTIYEEYTSNEEPSVAEFKNWMKAISDYFGSDKKHRYKKLIIVFDNMDRLPSEKVMQLWSSIYTFFAGGNFENVWAIIPYDYKHLCQAIYGSEDNRENDEDAERIKQFISKTFPITYHVPQPVITDYRKLFNTYFDEAFGAKEHDKEHICQVFMHLNSKPNPRTVIRFVNELVAMRLQWGDMKYRLQNQALFILKKDFLFYEGERLDAQLLSNMLFDKVSPFYPNTDKVRTELCQYAYGLEDEKLASELPLRNELKLRIEVGEPITDYVTRPDFLSVFEDVLADIDQATLNNAVKSMASLDGAELSAGSKERIQGKWDFLANLKANSQYNSHQYDETLTTLINHASPIRVIPMSQSFATAMQHINVTDGASYFQAQNALIQALNEAKIEFDDSDWYKSKSCEPEQFVQYVREAKSDYDHYGLTPDLKALNEYLLNGTLTGNTEVATVVDYIKSDTKYDLTGLQSGLSKAIKQDSIKDNITVAAYIHRVLSQGDEVLKVRLKEETVSSYMKGDRAPWEDKLPVGLEDVMAMYLADGNDLMEVDDSMIPRICTCMGRYMNYTHLLKNTGKDGSVFRKLNTYCVEHQKGYRLDVIYAARHLYELQSALNLDIAVLLKQFNRWQSIDWGELNSDNDYVKEVKNYVQQPLFKAYLDNSGNFSDSIIKLGVETLSLQNTGFIVRQHQVQQGYSRVNTIVIDDYWADFVKTYLGTNYLREADELLTNEAVTMLQWLYDHNEVKEKALLDAILQYPNAATLRSYLHSMMNDHLSKTNINGEKFLYFGKLLPMLGSDMDANTARGLITHFIKPICKDADCAAIIIEHKDFYLSVMRHDRSIAEATAKEMAGQEIYASMADDLKKIEDKKEEKQKDK